MSAPAASRPARFAALKNKDCRPYLFGSGIAMMADNIEHVITYWVLWQTFHSESLVGFQMVSHWVPFLLFSVYCGNLADRYDCRRSSRRVKDCSWRSRSPGACCSSPTH